MIVDYDYLARAAPVIERAAHAIVRYKQWHAQQVEESGKRTGTAKYRHRALSRYTARTADRIVMDYVGRGTRAGYPAHWSAYVCILAHANKRAEQLWANGGREA